MDWKVILLAIAFIALMVVGLSVKLIFKKNGKFSGTCASQSPFLNESGESCSFCGAKPDEQCKNS
ncbi:MAG: membrane or secreted protein [Candidatus Competibacteraceae bacterium]|nr:membrane or secreted protein [Candidatus Competibacteraceae bacterium]